MSDDTTSLMHRVLLVFTLLGIMTAAAALDAATLDDAKNAVRQKDYQTAARMLEELAAAGTEEAQYILAGLYRSGRGVEIDDAVAVKWYRLAADQGHIKAQYHLGVMLERGWGGIGRHTGSSTALPDGGGRWSSSGRRAVEGASNRRPTR